MRVDPARSRIRLGAGLSQDSVGVPACLPGAPTRSRRPASDRLRGGPRAPACGGGPVAESLSPTRRGDSRQGDRPVAAGGCPRPTRPQAFERRLGEHRPWGSIRRRRRWPIAPRRGGEGCPCVLRLSHAPRRGRHRRPGLVVRIIPRSRRPRAGCFEMSTSPTLTWPIAWRAA